MNTQMIKVVTVFVLVYSAAFSSTQTTPEKQQDFASHLQKAQGYLRENHPDLAIPELEAAATLDPSNTEVQANLGVLLYFSSSFAKAIPHLRIALQAQPSLAKIQGLLGIAEARTGNFTSARQDLETSFPNIPDQKFKTQAGLELLSLQAQMGDLSQAAMTVAALRKSDPDNVEVMYAAYRTYSDIAGESMLALSLAAPDSAQMHQVLAEEAIRQGDSNGAAVEFRKAIATDSHLPGIHFELAELLYASQDMNVRKQAEPEYRLALQANPQDEKALRRLGEIDSNKGNSREAFVELSKAVELQPTDADAKVDLAKVLVEMNQSDQALALLEAAIQLEPTHAVAHYRLATLYRQKGRADDARREMETYKKYRDLKEKLRATYKGLMKQPNEIRSEDVLEK